MIRSISVRLAVLVLAAGLIAVLPASAAAKPKATTKVQVVDVPFLLQQAVPQADAAAVCPSRTTLLSGGALANTPPPAGPPEQDIEIYRSGPIGNAWYVGYESDADVDLLPSAQAICIKDKLKTTGVEGSPKAISKVTRVNTPFALPPDDPPTDGHAQIDVPCPKGTTIAGGGAWFSTADSEIQLQESGPQGNGWHVRYDNDSDAVTAVASALCLKSKLKVKGEGEKARSKFEQVDQTVTLPPAATNIGRARFNVDCPKGTRIVGGGGKIDPAAPLATTDIQLEESGAVGNGWQVTFDNDEAVALSASVHALCLKKKLKVK